MMLPEKMSNRYTTAADIQARLSDTYIRYGDDVVYVSGLNDSQTKLLLYKIPIGRGRREDGIEVPFDDKKLDISSIELGYMNYKSSDGVSSKNVVAYVYRQPGKRSYRQGVSAINCLQENLDGRKSQASLGHSSPGWCDLLRNIYPEDYQSILSESGEVALSREFAVRRDRLGLSFFYVRGEQVGYSTPNSTTLNLVDRASTWAVERMVRKAFPKYQTVRIEAERKAA